MRGADFDDEIRSLVKPPSGFTGQHLLITPDKQKLKLLGDCTEAPFIVNQFYNTTKQNLTKYSPFQQQLLLTKGSSCGWPLHSEAHVTPLMASVLTGLSVKGVDSEGAMS